jgi:multiple sugar transport system substrate-binding protein
MHAVAKGIALTAAFAFLIGCRTGTSEADGRVRLRFSGYAGNPAETDLMKMLVDDFNRGNPDVFVTYEPVPGQYYPKLLTMLVSNTAPDVFYLDILAFRPFLAKQKILRPLNDLIARSRALRREDFVPELIDAFTDGDEVYGIPKDFNTLGLFYNKAMFTEAGVAVPDTNWDLDKLREVAKRLTTLTTTANGIRQFGFALTHDNADRYLPIAASYGARLFDDRGKCALAGPEGLAAMQYYAGLTLVDHSAIYPSEVGSSWTGDTFGRRAAAMVFEGSWLIPYLKDTFPDVPYGVTELPTGPKGRSNFLFTVAYAIPQSSKHVDAAWRLIEFLTSEASQSRVTFALPSRKSISARYAAIHPEYLPILAGAAYAKPYEFGRKGTHVSERLGVAVQEVFLAAKPPERALRDACDEIDLLNSL